MNNLTVEQRIELHDRWLAALEGGEYKQGKDYLRAVEDTYCCLGVLCEVTPGRDWKLHHQSYYVDGYQFTSISFPPWLFLEQVGLYPSEGELLARLNDTGHTFKEIAKEIRKLDLPARIRASAEDKAA